MEKAGDESNTTINNTARQTDGRDEVILGFVFFFFIFVFTALDASPFEPGICGLIERKMALATEARGKRGTRVDGSGLSAK